LGNDPVTGKPVSVKIGRFGPIASWAKPKTMAKNRSLPVYGQGSILKQ
jgi:topoisomerase IA-like protein